MSRRDAAADAARRPDQAVKVSASDVTAQDKTADVAVGQADRTVFAVLFAISFAHLLNDTIQSLLPALYPILKDSFALSFAQIGLITLAFQSTASTLQPVVGLYADRRPMPYSLTIGMAFTCAGVLLLATAPNYFFLLVAAALIGLGSAVFHPESSRVARMAAGRQRGLAQSLFQVGGNAGSAVGPLLAAFVFVAIGQAGISWFAAIPLVGMVVLWKVGRWYRDSISARTVVKKTTASEAAAAVSRQRVVFAVFVLFVLIFSKQIYMTSLTNFYTFYLIETFGVEVPTAQVYLFVYLFAIAAGTLIGGWLSDRLGRRRIIWFSILGALPFTLALPYANLPLTAVLTIVIGMIMASSVSVIIVFAQDLIPGKVGMVSGLFLGFAFGIGGIGAALLGVLADYTSLDLVFSICSFLPAIGLATALLPDVERHIRPRAT